MYIFIIAQQFGIISAPCQNFLHLHPLHRLLRAGFGGVDGAQGLQVAVRFFRGALHGGNLGFLGFGQVLILRQQVGVAGYDRQRGFQVMGQGGGLLGALLFQLPLALQAGCQLAAHCLHSPQRFSELPHLSAGNLDFFRALGGDCCGSFGQLAGLPRQHLHRAVGTQRQPYHLQQNQQQNIHGLEIRQDFPQRRVRIGHRIIILQNAACAIRHIHHVLVVLVRCHHPLPAAR